MKLLQRVPHYLKPNRKARCPSNLLFVDTETNQIELKNRDIEHRLKLWYSIAYRLEGEKETRKVEKNGSIANDFWLFVYSRLDKRRPLWLFAHNAAFDAITLRIDQQFKDGKLLSQILEDSVSRAGGFETISKWQGLLVLDSPPTIIELMHKETNCKLIIVDTLNYWRCSLAEIGKSIGLEKLAMPDKLASKEDWITYCQRDCQIISLAIKRYIEFVRREDLGNFRYTTVSQGLQAYRHRFMQHKLLVHCEEPVLKLERDGYFGGDCTIYQLGKVNGPVYVLDVQSFYPSICAKYKLPYCFVKHVVGEMSPASIQFARQYYLIARCRLNTPNIPFPIRHRGQLVKATGKFETVLHQPELEKALKYGVVEYVSEIALYQSGLLFRKYVEEMWYKRLYYLNNGNETQANFFKLLLNAPFGKFGQKQQHWIDCPEIFSAEAFGTWKKYSDETGKTEEFRCFAHRVQRRRRQGESFGVPVTCSDSEPLATPALFDESPNSIPQIPGAITSYGRVELEKFVEIAGHENVFYTDTDCLHTNHVGFVNLNSVGVVKDSTLGMLSVRGIHQETEYKGIKYYRVDDTWVIAGVKQTAKSISPGVFQQYDFSGWNSLLCGSKDLHILQREVNIDRNGEYIPGFVSQTGRVSFARIFD